MVYICRYGGIQQLRGQEGGRGVSKKSTLVHPGGGGSQDVHVDKNFKNGTEESWQMSMKNSKNNNIFLVLVFSFWFQLMQRIDHIMQ